MDYPWELVLDHSYAMPGVIFDQSPGRAGHGIARGIADADFLVDGATRGSGAVRFRGGTRAIRADLGTQAAVVDGVAIDMVCTREAIEQVGTLIESEAFTLEIDPPHTFQGWVLTQGSSQGFAGSYFTGELHDWNTVTFLFDGWENLDVTVNGEYAVHYPARGEYWPMIPGRHIAIGNRLNGTNGLNAVVDDVKIWRLDPRKVDNNLRQRPVFNDVSSGWWGWGVNLVSVFKDDMECALELRRLIEQALGALRRAVASDEAYDRWNADALEYQKVWNANQPHKIVPIATNLLQWLRGQGVEPMNLPELQALLRSPCFKKLLDHSSPPNDNAFHNMILGIAQGY